MRTHYSFTDALKTCCLVALVALISTAPALAQTTFGPFSASPALAIPDGTYDGTLGSMASSTIAVSGITGTSVIDIEVDVNINHTWIGDLTIKLVSPDGDILTLVSRPGYAEAADDGSGCCGPGTDWLGSTLTFTDLGALDAEAMTTPFTGTYYPNPGASSHPTQTFASLFGGTMNGDWVLYAGDSEGFDAGTLNSWAIRITTVSPAISNAVFVAVEDGNGDCSDDVLSPTPVSTLNVPAGTDVCYFFYVQNDGDVDLNLHDVVDSQFGALQSGLPFSLLVGTGAQFSGMVTVNSNITNTTDWTAYNAGPTDVATSSASASVFIIPDNDLCAGAQTITCGETVTGTTAGSSDVGNPTNCSAFADDLGVWYTFTGNGLNMRLTSCGPVSEADGQRLWMSVLEGDCGALTCVSENNPTDADCGLANAYETETFSTVDGATYYVFVTAFNGFPEILDFNLTLECADCNGDFGGTASVDCNNVCSGGNTGIAPGNSVTLDMTDDLDDGWNGGTYEIFDNSDPLNPVSLVSGDLDNAQSGDGTGIGQDLLCLPDGCYLITVGGGSWDEEIGWTLTGVDGGPISGGAPESVAFSINTVSCDIAGCNDPEAINYNPEATVNDGSCIYPPANDDCAGAIVIDCSDTGLSGTTTNSTVDAEYSNCGAGGDNTTQRGVWYMISGDDQQYTITTCDASGTGYDTRLTVFSGSCGSFTCVTGNDDMSPACTTGSFRSEVTFNANSGTDYYVFVHGFQSGTNLSATGDFILNISCSALCLPLPGNDECANATALTVNTSGNCSATTGTTDCAGAATNNPTCFSAFATLADVWYSFVAPADGEATMNITNVSAVGTGYAVYDACGGTEVDCDNAYVSGTDVAWTGLTAGATYYVQVMTNGVVNAGDFTICISGNVPDCNGDLNGTAFLDDCNVCVGGNTGLTACVQDCNGDFGGTAFLDDCNVCVGGNTGLDACVQDCNGDFGGTAFIDECDDCVGGNTGLAPCIPTGVEEGLGRNLSVYPNPNNGQFIVELNGAEGVGTLNIMDMMGRRVYTAGVNLNGSFRQSIDLNVVKGTYVLQVITESGIATRKVELH